MNKSGRKLSRLEIFVIIISLAILGYILYMYLFDAKIEEKLKNEAKAQEEIQESLTDAYKQIREMRTQQAQMLRAEEAKLREMPSYPAVNEEVTVLDSILKPALDTDFKHSDPVRTDDQVRRGMKVQFKTYSYEYIISVIDQISNCAYRCLIDEVRCTEGKTTSGWNDDKAKTVYDVEIRLTFYETMYGGRADEALKESKKK